MDGDGEGVEAGHEVGGSGVVGACVVGEVTVRCKFTCDSRREFTAGPTSDSKLLYDYTFRPIYDADKTSENGRFWEWTPGGQLNVTSVKDSTFVVGQAYYLDLTPVPAMNIAFVGDPHMG